MTILQLSLSLYSAKLQDCQLPSPSVHSLEFSTSGEMFQIFSYYYLSSKGDLPFRFSNSVHKQPSYSCFSLLFILFTFAHVKGTIAVTILVPLQSILGFNIHQPICTLRVPRNPPPPLIKRTSINEIPNNIY